MKSVLLSIQPQWCEKICNQIGTDQIGKPLYEKSVDVRKTRPKLDTPFKVYIYCTFADNSRNTDSNLWITDLTGYNWLGNGKVIGEFVCDEILNIRSRGVKDNYDYCYESLNCFGNDDIELEIRAIKAACIGKNELSEYAQGTHIIYGWHISDLKIYDKPRELGEFRKPYQYDCDGFIECDYNPCCYVDEDGCFICHDCVVECPHLTEKYALTRAPQSWCYVEGELCST